MLGAGGGLDQLNRLGFRLVALLSVALLPLGLIAILQTYRVIDEANQRTEAALIGETVEAASYQRELIQTAIGAAEVFAISIEQYLVDRATCDEPFTQFVDANPSYVFAGFIEADGTLACSSTGDPIDFTGYAVWEQFRQDQTLTVNVSQSGRASGLPVVVVNVPIFDGDEFRGGVPISISLQTLMDRSFGRDERSRPDDVITFNARGDVLTSARGIDTVSERLPVNRSLAALNTQGSASFTDTVDNGEDRFYTVVPLIGDAVFAMAVWPQRLSPGYSGSIPMPTLAFPILMWLASVAVAYFAVHRLVIRHVRHLRHQIRVFSSARRTLPDPVPADMPSELREVAEAFYAMTERILADEADLANSLHDKNVLLKEVHHRVKNNLQLITSMVNMQIRRCDSNEAKDVLHRLQDRVLGLSVIHRSLYHASSLSKVRADILVREIVNQLLMRTLGPDSGIRVTHSLDTTVLYPDQAVPLALMANEAITNSLKFLGRPSADTDPWIDVKLHRLQDGRVELVVQNSTGEPVAQTIAREGYGLGSQLMRAFTTQLGAELTSEELEDRFSLSLVFEIADFDQPEDRNGGA
ncbi:sensor histidine kinase [Anianabacter salinae]|uniref:sensor histidine kinase n=1 Tax=Anianabacter salinae TaxID=2851023 RepID=UPI00225E44C1|nr:histidine kinase dimerization/phosphoacceptor domain -containing protein [Anianabacter salinae]MBV0913687.1 histidine kinase [Anianabacter salinae]